MRNDWITEEEVFRIANELFAKGGRPTQEAIRKIAGKGSYSTINKYLKEWKKLDENAEAENILELVPKDIQVLAASLNLNLVERIWVKAVIYAEENVKQEMFSVLEDETQKLREKIMSYEERQAEMQNQMAEFMKQMNTKFNQGMPMDKSEKQHYEEKIANLEEKLEKLVKQLTERVS